jgi:hypothetical protein
MRVRIGVRYSRDPYSVLADSAFIYNPTLNEPAHLVSGMSHWKLDAVTNLLFGS